MNRTALLALCALLPFSLNAQTANDRFTFLGNARSYDRTPNGVVIPSVSSLRLSFSRHSPRAGWRFTHSFPSR